MMVKHTKILFVFILCICILCFCGCLKSDSVRHLELLEKQGVTDNVEEHMQNSDSEQVQMSSTGTYLSRIKGRRDRSLYQIENRKHMKIAEEVDQFLEFQGKIYYRNENEFYCYDPETENTKMLFSVSGYLRWFGIYEQKILCLRLNSSAHDVLELYNWNGKLKKKFFEEDISGQIMQMGNYIIFLDDLEVQVYDLKKDQMHALVCAEGLSNSYMAGNQGELYISLEHYMIGSNYNQILLESEWNGFWKISMKDMESGKWELTKISEDTYEKFYCAGDKLFDEKFKEIVLQ